jgi:hypothetical protein
LMMMMRKRRILSTLGLKFMRIIDGGWGWIGLLPYSHRRDQVGESSSTGHMVS